MIFVGIDDTDTLDTRGTNQLARALVRRVADRFRCVLIVRHQLLDDPRVPYTSKNGSASILLEPLAGNDTLDARLDRLIETLRTTMRDDFIEGSDPGLCVAASVPDAVVSFAHRCKSEVVTQNEARELARRHGIHLEGLGGTEDGVIGALAAVGLAADGNDGRIVQIGGWPDDLCGVQPIEILHARVAEVRERDSGRAITGGLVDVGKHLRPNRRAGRIVLTVTPNATDEHSTTTNWTAIRLT